MKLPSFFSLLFGFFFKQKPQTPGGGYDGRSPDTNVAPLSVSGDSQQPAPADSHLSEPQSTSPAPGPSLSQPTISEPSSISPAVMESSGSAQPAAAPSASYSGFPSYEGFPADDTSYSGFPDEGGSYAGFPTYSGFPTGKDSPTQTPGRPYVGSGPDTPQRQIQPVTGWVDSSTLTDDMTRGVVSLPASGERSTDPLSIKDDHKS